MDDVDHGHRLEGQPAHDHRPHAGFYEAGVQASAILGYAALGANAGVAAGTAEYSVWLALASFALMTTAALMAGPDRQATTTVTAKAILWIGLGLAAAAIASAAPAAAPGVWRHPALLWTTALAALTLHAALTFYDPRFTCNVLRRWPPSTHRSATKRRAHAQPQLHDE